MPTFLIIGAFLKCSIAKIGFEENKVFEGFEALAHAQCLLKSTKSLQQMTLLSQVIVVSICAFASTLLIQGLPRCALVQSVIGILVCCVSMIIFSSIQFVTEK